MCILVFTKISALRADWIRNVFSCGYSIPTGLQKASPACRMICSMRYGGLVLMIMLGAVPISAFAASPGDTAQGAWAAFERGVGHALDAVEAFRLGVYDGAVAQQAAAQAERDQEAARLKAAASGDTNLDTLLDEQGRPRLQEVKDSSGIAEGLTAQVFAFAIFVFGSVFVFYGIIVAIVSLAIRLVWKMVHR